MLFRLVSLETDKIKVDSTDWCNTRGFKTSFFGFDLNARRATIYDDGKKPVPATLLSTIGAAVASTLKNPSLTANRYIYISDYKVSQNEVLALLMKATGGDKWEVLHRTTAEARSNGFEKLTKGDFTGIGDLGDLILASIYGSSKETDYSLNREIANGSLGLPRPEPLDVVVEKIVKGEKV